MPYFSVELHLWGLEWIVWWNINVHVEDTALIACVFLQNRTKSYIGQRINQIKTLSRVANLIGNQKMSKVPPINESTYGSENFSLPMSEIVADYFGLHNLFSFSLLIIED